jgi:hypothetical protein
MVGKFPAAPSERTTLQLKTKVAIVFSSLVDEFEIEARLLRLTKPSFNIPGNYWYAETVTAIMHLVPLT